MVMEIEATYLCAYCLQPNTIIVDGTGGLHQHYIEDCQICCRPNNLHIRVDEEMHHAEIQAEMA
jgi:hypothetical protein